MDDVGADAFRKIVTADEVETIDMKDAAVAEEKNEEVWSNKDSIGDGGCVGKHDNIVNNPERAGNDAADGGGGFVAC